MPSAPAPLEVIVGVRTPFVPEGQFADAAAVSNQRRAMRVAMDALMHQAEAAGNRGGPSLRLHPVLHRHHRR